MSTVALRTALIWHDEVMDDVVCDKPKKITIGNVGTPTFVVPDLGLPKNFAVVRPGNRGYLLTLGDKMRGTICIEGQEQDVGAFVRAGGEGPGGFRATPISGRDWGVIDLDESGDYKLFFQFVPVEDAVPFFTKPVLLAALGGYILSIAVLAGLFYWRGLKVDFTILDSEGLAKLAEAMFRGGAIATGALGISAIAFWLFKQEGESQASFGFSVLLHAALLFMTYQLYDGSDPFVWPGPRSLTGNYLVTRLETEKPPEPKPAATVGEKKTSGPSAPKTPEKPKNTATKNESGASGGKGEHERARDPNAKDAPPTPDVGFMQGNNRAVLDEVRQNLPTSLNKFAAIPGERKPGDAGYGHGTGTGVGNALNGTGTTRGGHGKGTGGGGNVEGDFESKAGPIDTGKNRPGGGNCATPPCGNGPKEVKLTLSDPEGDFGGLTMDEIDRVVKSRANIFRKCYQQELNRSPGIGGKLVMHFQIGGDGLVKSVKTGAGTSLHNDAVESCVSAQISHLKFPAKGGLANVNYPFVFQPGG